MELKNLTALFSSKALALSLIIFISAFTYNLPVNAEINCEWTVYQPVGKSPQEKYKKGYCYIKQGRFTEGVSLLNGLEKELPLIADYVIYYRGYGERILGNLNSASAHFYKILTDYPDSALRKKALIRVAEVYSDMGDHEKAERAFRSLYEEESDIWTKSTFLNNIGESLERQGKYSEALELYKELWVEYPASEFSGIAFDRAVQISQRYGFPFKPKESDYLKRGEKFFELSMWDSAIRNFERVTQTDEIQAKIAASKFNLGRVEEASKILKGIRSAESFFWLAKIKTKLGEDEEASKTYYQVYSLYPDSPPAAEALYNGARLYQVNANFEKAIEMYDLLLRKYPESEFYEDGAWNLGWIHYRQGSYAQALATFSAFTKSDSTFNASRATYWKARTFEKQGKLKEALATYETLARATVPSYYSYLAQRKTGVVPDVSSPGSLEVASGNDESVEKAELLIELGILEDADFEVRKMEEGAQNQLDLVRVSKLYREVGDFYSSIRVAQELDVPDANELAYPQGFGETIKSLSAKYKVDEFIVYSIIREESRFQEGVVSPAGAIGLMQIMPATGRGIAKELGVSRYSTSALYTPRTNIEFGISYFKKVLDEWGGKVHLALASYNAGPHNVAEWMLRFPGLEMDEFVEEIPFHETRNYVRRVLRSYGAYKAIYGDRPSKPKSGAS